MIHKLKIIATKVIEVDSDWYAENSTVAEMAKVEQENCNNTSYLYDLLDDMMESNDGPFKAEVVPYVDG